MVTKMERVIQINGQCCVWNKQWKTEEIESMENF